MAALKFASLHNMVAFLDKPTESDGFEQIVDFLTAHPIKYALTVNPTIYTAYIKQFWAIAKVKTVNGEVQIQALVDKKKVIITKTSIRSDLQLEDAEGTECLPNATIFEQLTLMGTMASAVICLAINQKFNFSKYIFDNVSKGKDFSGRDTPLFPTMIVQAQEQKKQSRRKQRKDTEDPQLSGPIEPVTYETRNVASVPTHSNDPLLSGEDRLKLNEFMELCTSLSQRVLDLENTNTSQAVEITELKKIVKKLEGKRKKDASKQGRKINEIDQDAEVTLVDETQGRYDDNLMFDTGVLDNEQDMVEKEVDMAEKEVDMAEKDVSTVDLVTTAGEVVTTTTTTVDELTLAQTLIKFKAAKPRAVIIAATTTTTAVTKLKARGVVVQEPNKIMFDKEVAQKLQAQLDAKLEEEEKLARQKEEDANIAEWDNVQAMMDANYELAVRLQAEEQGELTIEEKSRLFMELMNKRKKH
ncbi:hypothetical protein Tco_0813615, partial [Tanacetum coccineum]